MPCPCHALTMLFFSRSRHSMPVKRRPVGYLPAFGFFRLPRRVPRRFVIRSIPISDAGGQCEIKQRLSWTRKRVVAAHYKKDSLLNCWTSNSDISSYHADFHKGHSTNEVWHGTAWHGIAREWHAMCKSAFIVQTCPAAHPATVQWVLGLFPWSSVARVWL